MDHSFDHPHELDDDQFGLGHLDNQEPQNRNYRDVPPDADHISYTPKNPDQYQDMNGYDDSQDETEYPDDI